MKFIKLILSLILFINLFPISSFATGGLPDLTVGYLIFENIGPGSFNYIMEFGFGNIGQISTTAIFTVRVVNLSNGVVLGEGTFSNIQPEMYSGLVVTAKYGDFIAGINQLELTVDSGQAVLEADETDNKKIFLFDSNKLDSDAPRFYITQDPVVRVGEDARWLVSPSGNIKEPLIYHINWGDGTFDNYSGLTLYINHSYKATGKYNAEAIAIKEAGISYRKTFLVGVNPSEEMLVTNIDAKLVDRLKGRILLQVERYGEAWYLDPLSKQKFYLKNGATAYQALRKFGLGISNDDINKIPIGLENRFVLIDKDNDGLPNKLEEAIGTSIDAVDTDGDGESDGEEILSGSNPMGSGLDSFDNDLANRLSGRIVLQIQSHGEAWYINPVDKKRYYLSDGNSAYEIMRYLSLGITDVNLRKIPVGNFN